MARLGDVCEKGTSNIAQKDLEGHYGNYPIYGASGFIANVDFYQQEKPYIAVVKDGAGIGRIMKLPAKSSVIGTMQYIIPNDIVDISFLAYAMENMNLSKYFTGATIPHIYFTDYRKEELPLPPFDEQRHIAAVLDKVSDLIAKRRQQLDKLDEIVKARFVEMFGEPDENPKHWQEDELSHHIKVVGGYAFKSDGFTDEGIPVLRIGNINSGHFLPVNMVYWPDDSELVRYKVFPGDLVMSLTGTVGKDDYGNVCILGDDYDEYYLNQRNAKLSIETALNKCYFSELLKFPRIKKRLTGISRGVRQANISNKDILTLRIPIPPIELQEQFASFVEQTEKTKTTINRSLDQLEALKKALMQEYFG